MTEPEKLVILFADICGSTRLYDTLGDRHASAAIDACLKQIDGIGRAHGGELIKTIGDEALMVFRQPDDAAAAAREMHLGANARTTDDGQPMALHVGFHQGSALRKAKDVLGDGVNVAARLVSLAKPGQTVTSASTLRQLSSDWQDHARHIDSTQVKGKTGPIMIYELIWQPEAATRMVRLASGKQDAGSVRLRIRHRDSSLELDQGRPIMTFGRADSCDLVIKHELVSRLHARLEVRKNRFLLTDQSTNGTYVSPTEGTPLFLRRDTQPIQGSGLIGLGAAVTEASPDAIYFTQLSSEAGSSSKDKSKS